MISLTDYESRAARAVTACYTLATGAKRHITNSTTLRQGGHASRTLSSNALIENNTFLRRNDILMMTLFPCNRRLEFRGKYMCEHFNSHCEISDHKAS